VITGNTIQSLFLISTRGLGTHYVIASNSHEAYQKTREWFDKNNYGFPGDRELDSVKLLAKAERPHNNHSLLWL